MKSLSVTGRRLLATAILACAAGRAAADCPGLKIDNAWIPEAPPVAKVMIGFATLSNQGDQPLHLEAGDGADFGSIGLHEMSTANGMMRMRPLKGLDLPAHGSVTLQDGGKHLMLMDPKRPLKAGDSTTLRFRCGAGSSSAVFNVRAAS